MLKNMKLGMRIALGYAIILFLLIGIIIITFISMNTLNTKLAKITDVNAKKIIMSQNMSSWIAEYNIIARDMIFLSDQTQKQE